MIHIGRLKLKSKYLAAPMAGYTDYSWRILAARGGAGLVYSEMVSVEGLSRNHKKTARYIENSPEATPFCVQLFGTDHHVFAKSLDILNSYPFDMIDINMGCPVRKVVGRGSGAALMKNIKQAELIIKTIKEKYNGPLSAKIRAGWDEKTLNAVEMAKAIEASGADAVIVHPRTREQGYRGTADWKIIRAVKKAVKIAVIGNGDVTNPEEAGAMFNETGCDAIMIGRASLSNPFIFRTLSGGDPISNKEIFSIIEEHIKLARERETERYTANIVRKFVPKYLRKIDGFKALLQKIGPEKSVDKMIGYILRSS